MPETFIQDKAKEAAGREAANLIQEGMTVGLGTGSTVAYFLKHLSKRCQNGLNIQALATSHQTSELAKKYSIPLMDSSQVSHLTITVDGADEIDSKNQMIKGGGGALLREKITASMPEQLVIIVDEKKCVEKLGKFPLPLEISPFGYLATLAHLKKEGFLAKIRMKSEQYFMTDNGNYIADLTLNQLIDNPAALENRLRGIIGVLETGLFINLAKTVIIGHSSGRATIK